MDSLTPIRRWPAIISLVITLTIWFVIPCPPHGKIMNIPVNKGFPDLQKVLRIHRAHRSFVFNTRF